MAQRLTGQVVTGAGASPGPKLGAGDGGVMGQDRGGPQFLHPADGGRHLQLGLVRQSGE